MIANRTMKNDKYEAANKVGNHGVNKLTVQHIIRTGDVLKKYGRIVNHKKHQGVTNACNT